MAVLLGILQILALVILLALVYRPLGDYMARMFTTSKDLRVERGFYRVIGVDSGSEQTWRIYLRSVLIFSLVGVLLLYAIQRLQAVLPYALGFPAIPEGLSFNTAASFVSNTNWQSYSPDVTMGYAVQLGGLVVQNFLSVAVGIAVAIALVRGLAFRKTGTLGNFWVDLTRVTLRLLLPLSIVGAVILIAGGVIQNFNGFTTVHTLTGATQSIPGGPVASQEVIKELGNNGGGFYNVNSAHPFENPTAWTNLFEIFLMLAIPFALTRTFGQMVGDKRQGNAILAVMASIFVVSLTALTLFETLTGGAATRLAGAAMEGKEQRFGIWGSTLFATTTTLTSTGAVNSRSEE
ncbi:MAG: Potassium-transporting ATPase subunit, partial [Microbacteriaceae bacterium]|nr:Potassium-transporting ATPase subunit [Microbacteriaceae bacterium]